MTDCQKRTLAQRRHRDPDCGCRGHTWPGPFRVFEASYAVVGAVEKVIPVDLSIRGCPPRPIDLLKGLVALVDKATARQRQGTLAGATFRRPRRREDDVRRRHGLRG